MTPWKTYEKIRGRVEFPFLWEQKGVDGYLHETVACVDLRSRRVDGSGLHTALQYSGWKAWMGMCGDELLFEEDNFSSIRDSWILLLATRMLNGTLSNTFVPFSRLQVLIYTTYRRP